ncbi:alpha/beta hydrolase [Mycobacterium antarcticum]|uniref:alpha/beta hydrolase n=1 Tax=unclassified Mycolicibacterium TaxID=2636767 RepID=UPI002382DD3F|nr:MULTISPECIES: alpha/beta hydrolase [unclassified Mycolicibacterium]BDX32913.1 alpha/beta hydrolase [Mycolicibacterium sp. TUM20985]GLP76091.1 alpha/beta hydrolase [Mycolicibacterium sp. TUM20983]GLP83529.1 alpha/beta hydrolase [Mycolicibacterium sp. TUM20984]
MAVNLHGVTVVLLPGTGSDDDYVYRAFSAALHGVGAVVTTPAPDPSQLVGGYLEALENAARLGPIAVGGISIGAAVATSWALAHPTKSVAVLAALPPWTGAPDTAAAALTARHSAQMLRRDGLASAIGEMRASSPPWLSAELTRSWVGQWPGLPDAMEAAAGYVAPTSRELETLTAPMGVAAATDDPVHPVEVAIEWVAAAPRAAVRTFTLTELGADPGVLGAACVDALMEL